MICPICGTQQRVADRCVQCHTPITEEKYKTEEEDSLSGFDPSPEESFTTVPPQSSGILTRGGKQQKSQDALEGEPTHETYPSTSTTSKEPQEGKASAAAKSPAKNRSQAILVATTQRVEGKRIGKYFGLVHGSVVVDLSDLSISPTGTEYQAEFKRGTMEALKLLKAEAALVGANAVVAASFDHHRIDTQVILLSAVGTAVLLEGPKAS